jgi:putative FmdB family regulatory protein
MPSSEPYAMPIYAFECDACGHNFERLQKLSDADPTVCPECGAEQIRRQLTAPQFRLAGGGWYETDFKKDGDKKRNLAGEGSSGGSASAGSGESKAPDSKPAGGKAAESKPAESKPAPAKADSKPAA